MGFIINPYQVQPSGGGYGTLTTAWIAATGETDTTILGALNTLESDLTTYGLTSKIKALYPFVGGTATKHKYNFMNAQDTDAAFRLVFSGGWTHDSNGALSGVNGYADTKLISSSSLTSNNTHMSYYSGSDKGNIEYNPIGFYSSASSQIRLEWYSGTFYSDMYDSSSRTSSVQSNSKGLFLGSRISSSSHKAYRNGSQIGTTITSSGGTFSSLTSPIWIGSLNLNGSPYTYSNLYYRLVSIGDGLTDSEAANFYTAVQAFQTTLSRNV